MALLSINGVGALTARATLFAWAHSPRTANHPKIVTIRALYRDPMPLIFHIRTTSLLRPPFVTYFQEKERGKGMGGGGGITASVY